MIVDVFQAISVSGVSSYLGSEYLGRNDLPPALVWVPSTSSFEAKSVTRWNATQPRSIGTERARAKVRAWARGSSIEEGEDQSLADYRGARDLMRRFIATLWLELTGNFNIVGMTWLTEQGAPLVEYGKAIDIEVEFTVPVLLDAPATTTIQTIENTDSGYAPLGG